MKKTLIASAVSAALVTPVAVQAADVSVYGRVHQGIQLVDPDADSKKSTTDFVGIGSRFGIKASSDLGNGMTASAQYEFATSSDSPGTGVANTRIAKVGISGSFGSVDLGNQWSAWYNHVGVHVDPTFSVGGSHHIGPFRTANTIKYSNSFGPVSLEVDARVDDSAIDPATMKPEEGGDGFAAAGSLALGDNVTLALGIDDSKGAPGQKNGETLVGGGVKVSFGNYWASVAHQSKDPEGDGPKPNTTQLWVGGSFGNTSVMIGTGMHDMDGNDNDPGNDPSDITWAVYHDLGGGFHLLYEGISKDFDNKMDANGMSMDEIKHLFGVRLDF